jgi:predicted transcriptional regulator
MEEFLPKVSTYLSLSSFVYNSAVLVIKKGKIVCVVTKKRFNEAY